MTRARIGRASELVVVTILVSTLAACMLFNQPPVARITATPMSGTSPLTVTFDGASSDDPEGADLTYAWDFGDGSTSDAAITQHVFVNNGDTVKVFVVQLTVIDDRAGSATASQSIEVQPAPPPDEEDGGTGAPTAWIEVDRVIGATPLQVTFDGRNSSAGGGTISRYNWNFGDGSEANGSVVTHTYEPAQTREYTATLFVWNTNGTLDTAQVEIIAIVPAGETSDEEPNAEFVMSDPNQLYQSDSLPTIPSLFEVALDPRGSYADAGHQIIYYVWQFGDGTWQIEESDLEVTHLYQLTAPSRTYVVRLLVYDDQGLEGTAVANLTLAQAGEE